MINKQFTAPVTQTKGWVHCLICSRAVEAEILHAPGKSAARKGQKCPRCSASLDPAPVLKQQQAA